MWFLRDHHPDIRNFTTFLIAAAAAAEIRREKLGRGGWASSSIHLVVVAEAFILEVRSAFQIKDRKYICIFRVPFLISSLPVSPHGC